MAKRVKIEIKETIDELQALIKQETNAKKKERLQLLYLLQSDQVPTLEAIAIILGKNTATLYRWLKQYRQGGLSQCLDLYQPQGKPCLIPAEIIEKLKERLQNPEGFLGYQEIQEWLKNEHQLDVGYHVVYRVVRRVLRAKPKVPRPKSSKRNEAKAQAFKQDLGHQIQEAVTLWNQQSGELIKPKRIRFWCQDEARVGLKTVVGRVITLFGVKPTRAVQWSRRNFYIYGLFEPESGESFYCEFSHVNTECFQIFLHAFAKIYFEDLHVIQLDQASFHLSQNLTVPKNVILLFQPAHSPELNPAERVWEYVRSQLRWFNAQNLNELREKLDEIYAKLTQELIASLTGWRHILDALSLARS